MASREEGQGVLIEWTVASGYNYQEDMVLKKR